MKSGARQSGFGAGSERRRRYRVAERERPAIRPRIFARRDMAAGSSAIDVIWDEGVGSLFSGGKGEGRELRGTVRWSRLGKGLRVVVVGEVVELIFGLRRRLSSAAPSQHFEEQTIGEKAGTYSTVPIACIAFPSACGELNPSP